MNKTKNIQNKNKFVLATAAIVVALALISSPLVEMDDAFATHKKGNKATQSIDQSQTSNQNGLCVSGAN